CRHDLPVLAEPACRHLLVDPRLLDRMEPAVCREPLERGDFRLHGGHLRDARPRRDAVDDDGARAALAEPTSEPRTLQAEIVSQDVQKRRLGVDVDRMRRPVDLQLTLAHRLSLQNSASANAVSVVPAGMSTNCLLSIM